MVFGFYFYSDNRKWDNKYWKQNFSWMQQFAVNRHSQYGNPYRRTTFRECTGLTSVVIPDRITSIGRGAFCLCSNLASVVIPAGVTEIDEAAFYGCKNLVSVVNLNPTPQITGDKKMDVFGDVDLKSATLYVPVESVELYKVAEEWKDFGIITVYEL
jgi:hypothetical protein